MLSRSVIPTLHTWVERVRNEHITAQLGVSCPKCWCPYSGLDDPESCQCPDEVVLTEEQMLRSHGLLGIGDLLPLRKLPVKEVRVG